MKIKALQLFGFKSFGDRAELTFDRQTVGVVGPNGCGKSNIVDAIRWAMGEQSAKGLRGTEMADVIFNGTATRKRANFAEVSCIFENNQGLAPAPYHECSEIMITRRLYRSGESEYLINKVPVRLKDINDLFLGTGSSARAYSIVAQGKIDQIVLAKPEDRRFLLEEAAGIAKYKVRKQAAERKMEATKANLERIQDIIQELERSVRHLERQVEKAEQFRKIQTELRQLDEQIISAKVAKLEKLASANSEGLATARIAFESSSKDLNQLEARIEGLRLEALNQEKISASDYEQLIREKEAFANADKELELRVQRIQNLRNQIEERKKDIERLKSKNEASQDVAQQLLAEREKVQEEKDREEVSVAELKKQLEALSQEIDQADKDLQRARTEMDQKKAARIREESRREVLQSERIEVEMRRSERERSLEEFSKRREDLLKDADVIARDLEKAELDRTQAESDLKNAEVDERRFQDERAQLLRMLSDKKSERSRYEGELQSLETLEQHAVGYESGAVSRREATGESFLLDRIRFKSGSEKIAEAFFDEFGQTFATAERQSYGEGRWSRVFGSFEGQHPQSLMDLADGDVPPELHGILRSIEIVDQISDVQVSHIQIDRSGAVRIPVASGVVRENLGEILKTDSPFARKQEIEDLKNKIANILTEISDVETQIQERVMASENASRQIQTARAGIRQFMATIQSVQSRRAQVNAQIESADRRRTEFQEEVSACDVRVADIDQQLQTIAVFEDLSALEAQTEQMTQKLQASRQAKAELDGKWIEKRIAFGALLERLERLEQQTIHHEMTRSEYEHNTSLYQTDIENWSSDITKEEGLIADLQAQKTSGESEMSVLERRLAENKDSLNKIRSEVDQAEVARKTLQSTKDQHQSQLQDLELEHQRLKFEVEEISQIVQERYHISLQEVLQQVTPETLERLEDETILKSLEVDALELRSKLEKFGEVNLLALSEFEEIKKRLDFMHTQRDDLLKTLDALHSIIERINKITEFRFRETFSAINHNFQLLFPKLFGGGKAYMTLTDEKNLLETGIEIFAEPPGKKVQSMSLLSGGEKAMTSISLLFALFAYRPASFCILDEVDAPLDEVNTVRYNQIIQEMSALSQFIVITHNKRTMEVADKLFGVTMQEPGVSQLVAVELQEARAMAS